MSRIKLNASILAEALVISLVAALTIVSITAVFYGGSFRQYPFGKIPSPAASPSLSAAFAGCDKLKSGCNDDKCKYYWMCDIADYKNCEVYDCGKDYGVAVTPKSGKIISKKYPKPDMGRVSEKISACQGSVKIVSDKCEKSIDKITTEVITAGNCPVEAFIFKKDNEWQSADFTKSSLDNNYLLTIPFCAAISDITAVGSQGITIGSAPNTK